MNGEQHDLQHSGRSPALAQPQFVGLEAGRMRPLPGQRSIGRFAPSSSESPCVVCPSLAYLPSLLTSLAGPTAESVLTLASCGQITGLYEEASERALTVQGRCLEKDRHA